MLFKKAFVWLLLLVPVPDLALAVLVCLGGLVVVVAAAAAPLPVAGTCDDLRLLACGLATA